MLLGAVRSISCESPWQSHTQKRQMWKQEPRELSAIKLTWMCLKNESKQQPGSPRRTGFLQVFDYQALGGAPQLGMDWGMEDKGVRDQVGARCGAGQGEHSLGLETGSSPVTANLRNLLGLSGSSPPPSSTTQSCS